MKLWLLTNIDKSAKDYDVYRGYVIRATNEKRARYLASQMTGDEGTEIWLNSDKSLCEQIKSNGQEEIIISDFMAG